MEVLLARIGRARHECRELSVPSKEVSRCPDIQGMSEHSPRTGAKLQVLHMADATAEGHTPRRDLVVACSPARLAARRAGRGWPVRLGGWLSSPPPRLLAYAAGWAPGRAELEGPGKSLGAVTSRALGCINAIVLLVLFCAGPRSEEEGYQRTRFMENHVIRQTGCLHDSSRRGHSGVRRVHLWGCAADHRWQHDTRP